MHTLLSEFVASSVWPWVTGAFVLLAGLIVVTAHQYWRTPAAAIVSVLGWLTALKGVFLLALPDTHTSIANTMVESGVWWQVSMVAVALVGLYLTVVGWVPVASRPVSQPTRSTPHLPHAA